MNKKFFFIVAAILFLSQRCLAEVSFPQSVTPIQLQESYRNGKLKILIVPGHDNESWGAEYKGIKEADLNLAVAQGIFDFLKTDSRVQVFITRDKNGYNPVFSDYFVTQKENIDEFKNGIKKLFNEIYTYFKVEQGVPHAAAKAGAADKLYGINKWANDNAIDIVLHIHFNDEGGRRAYKAGEHSGVAVYIPEKQLPNYSASKAVADSVFNSLKTIFPPSDLNKEDAGVVEDQKLIAIGPNASLRPAALLIESGFIYEPQYNSPIKNDVLKEISYLIYAGLEKYFKPLSFPSKYNSALLPYKWKKKLFFGMKSKKDILAAQIALVKQGVYPPPSFDLRTCPITGNFKECTREAVVLFQKKYNLNNTGVVDSATIKKLNELYAGQ